MWYSKMIATALTEETCGYSQNAHGSCLLVIADRLEDEAGNQAIKLVANIRSERVSIRDLIDILVKFGSEEDKKVIGNFLMLNSNDYRRDTVHLKMPLFKEYGDKQSTKIGHRICYRNIFRTKLKNFLFSAVTRAELHGKVIKVKPKHKKSIRVRRKKMNLANKTP